MCVNLEELTVKILSWPTCSAVVDKFEIAVLMSCASLYHTRDVKIDVLYVANCT